MIPMRLLLVLTLSSPLGHAQSPPRFTAEFLGPASSIARMNNAGEIVGSMPSGGATRAWIAGPGRPVALLPLAPGRVHSWAAGINDAGVIVGASSSGSTGGIATRWTPRPGGGYDIVELGKLPGHVSSGASAINNVGDIVGSSHNGTFSYPVLFTAQGVVDLSATGIFNPRDVNDQRVVVDVRAWRLDLATMSVQNLGVPAGLPSSYVGTYIYAINDSGQVAGEAILATSTSCDRQAARYTDGVGWEIFSACGPYNSATALNNPGDVMMQLNLAPWVRLEGQGTWRIEDLIDAPVGHWYVLNTYGLGINDARWMAVLGNNPGTGEAGLLLLVPGVGPGTPLCAGDGLAGSCPCGNSSAAGTGQGCVNSTGQGARLSATGSASVGAGDLVLQLTGAPPWQPGIFMQGHPGFNPFPYRDGLLCAGPPVLRLQVIVTSPSGTAATSLPIAQAGGVQPGQTWIYQLWHRDPAGPCGTGSNLSAALSVDWQ